MEGSTDNKGVAPRAVEELFENIKLQSDTGNYEYTVKFSMLEIYNETIRDLLDPSTLGKDKDKLDIRQTSEGINIVVGLIEEDVETSSRVNELMCIGQSNRAVGSHDMNEHSSRSHSILTLTVRGRNIHDNSSSFSKLHLIDLAGSERLSKTDATGDRLKEAQNINRSLSALGDVINALGNKKATHVPYRNSKLTFLLQVLLTPFLHLLSCFIS
jgi:kinesin family member C2/C3